MDALRGWTNEQKSVVVAAFMGWTLDAFDFFLLVFVLKDIAAEFKTGIPDVAFAIVLTLAMRPIGAFIFGRMADRYGRRPTLMVDILCYSLLAFASGFANSLTMLLILRGLFGIAMGGEWGVGASITMESIPTKARGLVSGLLQAGYPTGYFLASIVYGALYGYIGWRGMFMIGIAPAFLTFFILKSVKESPTWVPSEGGDAGMSEAVIGYIRMLVYAVLLMMGARFASPLYEDQQVVAGICILAVFLSAIYFAWKNPSLWVEFFAAIAILFIDYFSVVAPLIPLSMAIIYNVAAVLAGVFLKKHWRMGLYAVAMMTAFNFFSHGTQDLYPTFLQVQRGFSPALVGTLAVVYNIGAIVGSLTFGSLSERIGRRRAIVIASLFAIPVIPLWAYGVSPLWLAVGSFLMQFMVQSAWGVVPVHLNELSPADVRGTFPGFTYQLGNLLASVNATIQTTMAVANDNNYSIALAVVAIGAAVSISILVGLGVEKKGVHMGMGAGHEPEPMSPNAAMARAAK